MGAPWTEHGEGWRSFRGGSQWRPTPDGIEVWEGGMPTLPRSKGKPKTVARIMRLYGSELVTTARHMGVGVDVLVMLVCLESNPKGDARSLRMEPGYEDDEATPNKISVGLLQTLISTARMAGKLTPWGKGAGREDLYDPLKGLMYGAASLRMQYDEWQGDPVLASAVHNAGGAYASSRSDWNLRTYGANRIEHSIMWFNDFHFALSEGLFGVPYARLLSTPWDDDSTDMVG